VTKQSITCFTINDWSFTPELATLTCGDEVVELTPLQSGIFKMLINRHPQLVSASELLELLDEHAQGNRNKLYQSIAKLRKVFGDSTHNAQYIETVARKGYRLVPQPSLVVNDESTEVSEQSLDDVDIHSGVLEQNIFDDLGFIEHDEPEPTPAPTITVEPTPQTASPAVNNTTSPKQKISVKSIAVVAILGFLILAYLLTSSESAEPVAQTPETLYITPIKIHGSSVEEDTLTAQHVLWWLTQKLQHLPLIKVRPSTLQTQYPVVRPSLTMIDGQISSLSLEYWLNGEQRQAKVVSLNIATQINAQTKLQYQQFNQQLVSLILDAANVLLSDDICLNQDFITPQGSDNLACLLVLQRQGQHDNAVLTPQQIMSDFPANSLGFYRGALDSLRDGDADNALRLVSLALERNTNEPAQLMLLSQLYRDRGQNAQSLKLIKSLIDFEPQHQQYHYWLSYDLVALGYRQRALALLAQHDIELVSIADIIYFEPLNYNVIKGWLSEQAVTSEEELALIEARLSDSRFDTSLSDEERLAMVNQLTRQRSQRIDSRWQLASMYLANQQLSLAKKSIENDPKTARFIDTFSLSSDDRISYLPTYANILLQSDQSELAQGILQRLILLAQADPQGTQWTLTLAEAYALNGQPTQALAQLSKLLATGWLPHSQRRPWTLRNNPNFVSLRQQWEFINLLELIENRQKLMLLQLAEIKSALVE